MIKSVFYSAHSGSRKIANQIAKCFDENFEKYDILKNPIQDKMEFEENDVVVVAAPVFCGRIAPKAIEMIQKLQGNGAKAVAIAVFGNRDYDDALLELCDALKNKGFLLLSAGAFVAEHSVFRTIAKARPDNSDIEKLNDFANISIEKLKEGKFDDFNIKGNTNYKKYEPIPLFPKGNSKCTDCMACVNICPVGAISKENPRKTDTKKCTSCSACIDVCKSGARGFWGVIPTVAQKVYEVKCHKRVEPSIFM